MDREKKSLTVTLTIKLFGDIFEDQFKSFAFLLDTLLKSTSNIYLFSCKYRSASSAAIQPNADAVIAWR